MSRNIEPLIEAAKATPPISVIGMSVFGVSLSEWAIIGSVTLIALQIFFLLRKEVYLPWKAKRKQG
jgi:ABC-type nitrate/sulfonate/bicarbonate transport system permease component